VAQFCSTAWLSGNDFESTINFSIEGHRYSLFIKEIPALFGLANDDFHRVDIANERILLDNELGPLYFPWSSARVYHLQHDISQHFDAEEG
jgi:hypothetical protein